MAIDQAFRENGIEFALPQLRLRLPDNELRILSEISTRRKTE